MALTIKGYREAVEDYRQDNDTEPSTKALAKKLRVEVADICQFRREHASELMGVPDSIPEDSGTEEVESTLPLDEPDMSVGVGTEELPIVQPQIDYESDDEAYGSEIVSWEQGYEDLDAPKYSERQMNSIVSGYKNDLKGRARAEGRNTYIAYQVESAVNRTAAQMYRAFEQLHVHGPARKPVIKMIDRTGMPFDAHALTADFHAGMYVWGKESWGGDYDINIAAERLLEHGQMVVDWVRSQYGYCRRLYASDVGDFFHALDGKTAKGTILEQDTRAVRVMTVIAQAEINRMEMFRSVCDELVIKRVRGNHDHLYNALFQQGIQNRYRDDEDVRVDVPYGLQDFFISGSENIYERDLRTAHILDHGVSLGSLHTPGNMGKVHTTVNSVLGRLAGTVGRVIFYCGHLHHYQVEENGIYEMIRLPSMAETNDFETNIRVNSSSGAMVYRFDEAGRIGEQRRLYFDSSTRDNTPPLMLEGQDQHQKVLQNA